MTIETPRALAAAAALAALVAIAGCSPDNSKAPPAASDVTLSAEQLKHIRIVTVAPSRFRKTIEATGVVDFDNDQATSVLAPISGPVSRLLVAMGDRVRKGQPLAEVASPDFAAAVTTYRKTLAAAANARRLADLDQDLLAHSGVSAREAEQAESDAVGAEADRDAARQALVSLDVDPSAVAAALRGRAVARIDGVIRSPIAGTIVDRPITPGELLQAGTTPCFTVADLSRAWVMAQVFGSDLTAIGVGDAARITTGIGPNDLAGTVENISSVVDPDTRSVAVRVVVDNPGDLLKKQMYVRVLIQDRQESAGLLVPVSAVLRDDDNLPFVYAEQRDGGFARQHVTLGYRTGDYFDIPSGISPGNRVVADGAVFVQFMQSQ